MTDGYPSRDEEQSSFIELFESLEMSRLVLSDKPLYLTTLFVLMIVATILNLAVNYAEDHLMRWRQGLPS
jgi:ABC-type nitrate/sulfonate/bicarbonate transport system permease component